MPSPHATRVYYFTAATYALSNIARRRIKISKIADLNDPFELMGVDLSDERHRTAVSNSKALVDETCGVICFSRTWSNPVLWGHYADRHRGIALGFDVRADKLQEIFYATEPIQLKYETVRDKVKIERSTLQKLIATKFMDWKYEDELRLFVTFDSATAESGVHFLPLSDEIVLREVILGPKCQTPAMEIESQVNTWLPGVSIRKARMAFNSFTVVERVL